jgi:dihydroxyacetone kinase-like predicted kinase
MELAAEQSLTLEVTTASRAATIGGVSVKEGDFIGLVNSELTASAATAEACMLAMLEQIASDMEIATLFHSAAKGPQAASAFLERLEMEFPELEIELLAGAPDLYPYLMALE